MKTVIFQHAHGIIGEGRDLFEAYEDAQAWADEIPVFGGIEMFEMVKSPVDGQIYWTMDPETIEELKE